MNKRPKIIAVKIPNDLMGLLDDAIAKEDSDRSKFIRNAVRDRIRRSQSNQPRVTGQTSEAPAK